MSKTSLTDEKTGGVLVSLGDDRSTALAVVGGKGASLGRLVKAGFPVPPGFVITTAGYAAFICANDLEEKIKKILETLDYGDFDALEKETAKIREEITACTFPKDLADQIVGTYEAFGDMSYVAVRSSGTAEDLEGASCAVH